MMRPAKIALMGGMGYPITETTWGMPTLKKRLEALSSSISVILVSWDARQQVYDFLHSFDGFIAMAGDSLGAGSAGQYPGDLRRPVDYAAGFQPSEYDGRTQKDPQTGEYFQVIAPQIKRAYCIYDPWWIDTWGLGYARWRVAPGSQTKLLTLEHRGAHSDDWGISQDMVFNDLKGQLQ